MRLGDVYAHISKLCKKQGLNYTSNDFLIVRKNNEACWFRTKVTPNRNESIVIKETFNNMRAMLAGEQMKIITNEDGEFEIVPLNVGEIVLNNV